MRFDEARQNFVLSAPILTSAAFLNGSGMIATKILSFKREHHDVLGKDDFNTLFQQSMRDGMLCVVKNMKMHGFAPISVYDCAVKISRDFELRVLFSGAI